MSINNWLLKLMNLLMIIIVIGFGIKWWNQCGQQAFSPNANNTKEIEVAIVKKDKIIYQISASGKITSKVIKKIGSKTSGIVKLLSVKEGDDVEEGKILCIIKDPTIFGDNKEIERAIFYNNVNMLEDYFRKTYNKRLEGLESVKINCDSALKKYEQLQLLYHEGAISKQELTESELVCKRTNFQYHVAKSSFEQEIQSMRVIAPCRGTIILTHITDDAEVETGGELFLLADMRSPIANLVVDESDIDKIRVGQKVEITGDSFAPYLLYGVVEKIGGCAYQLERGFPGIEVICKIKPNKETTKLLKLDASCKAKIIIAEKENAICIPSIALLAHEEKTQVFVVNNSQVHLKKVITGIIGEELVEITDGLKRGETVVIIGGLDLQDGDYIRAKK